MRAALEVKKNLPESLLENPIMNRFFESFLSIELHVLLRFGKWADILEKPFPTNEKVGGDVFDVELFCIFFNRLQLVFVYSTIHVS